MRLVLSALLIAAALTGCGDGAVEPGGSWERAADGPIGPRWMPLAVWTGEEALFLGGGTDPPCPPNADCTEEDPIASDGAAYDPDADTWRVLAEAPEPVGYWFRPAVAGDTVVLFTGRRWLGYDVAADRWAYLPDPPERAQDTGSISAVGNQVHVLGRSGRVLVLDVDTQRWSRLPADTQRPRLTSRTVLATDEGVFLCGHDPGVPDDGDTPSFVLVDRWDGEAWTRYPQTGSVGWLCEHWTGEHIASLDIQLATGVDGDPPFGGRLDPDTGEWSTLPGVPDLEDALEGWSLPAAEGPLMSGWGYVYDDVEETWTPIGSPETEVDTDQSAVWADGRLVVFGGLDAETGYTDVEGLSDETWIWTP